MRTDGVALPYRYRIRGNPSLGLDRIHGRVNGSIPFAWRDCEVLTISSLACRPLYPSGLSIYFRRLEFDTPDVSRPISTGSLTYDPFPRTANTGLRRETLAKFIVRPSPEYRPTLLKPRMPPSRQAHTDESDGCDQAS